MEWNPEIRAGTTGGIVLSTIVQLSSYDLIQTVVCAAIGAVVSYMVTVLLKRVMK